MASINVLFPMAGDGTRFGGQAFKPFLDATEKKFIELAKDPFKIFSKQFRMTFYFIFRNDQEERFRVTETLHRYFPTDTIHCICLEEKTRGPLETVQKALEHVTIEGPTFLCDCDHSIGVKPFLPFLQSGRLPDILLPVWPIVEKDQPHWSKVKLTTDKQILSYHEKETIPLSPTYDVKGIIGCYLFKDINLLKQFPSHEGNFTELFRVCAERSIRIEPVLIEEAEFYGTPEQLADMRFNRARRYTFLVDIDGTLFFMPKHTPYDAADTQVLPGTIEKLLSWKQQGHRIILITGREAERRERLEKQLADLHIPYDELVMGTNSGTRIVINDKKPYCLFHKMAMAIQLPRNHGIRKIQIEDTPELVKTMQNGSFAKVYLIRKKGVLTIRKYIEKTPETFAQYEVQRRQVEDLRRFEYYSPGLTPKIYEVYESPDEFYFDMEYLEHSEELVKFPFAIIEKVLPAVVKRLQTDVYCYQKEVDGPKWLAQYLQEKIVSKYSLIESADALLYKLINNDSLLINERTAKGVRYYFSSTELRRFCPTHLSPIHGDLTLENILYNPNTNDFKFIDNAGSRYTDPMELDISKLFQSILAKYGEWDTTDPLYECIDDTTFRVPHQFVEVEKGKYRFLLDCFDRNTDTLYSTCLFYLATHLIRAVPYLLNRGKKSHAVLGLLLALYYLDVVTE